jgi:hypothetical protein
MKSSKLLNFLLGACVSASLTLYLHIHNVTSNYYYMDMEGWQNEHQRQSCVKWQEEEGKW